MPKAKCIVCGKAPAEVFRVCSGCAKTHDTTTGDTLTGRKRQKFYQFQARRKVDIPFTRREGYGLA